MPASLDRIGWRTDWVPVDEPLIRWTPPAAAQGDPRGWHDQFRAVGRRVDNRVSALHRTWLEPRKTRREITAHRQGCPGRRRSGRICERLRELVEHLEQQRSRRYAAEMTGHRRRIRSADPDADRVRRIKAYRPRVTIARRGSGLVGDSAMSLGPARRRSAGAPRTGRNVGHGPGRIGRQYPHAG